MSDRANHSLKRLCRAANASVEFPLASAASKGMRSKRVSNWSRNDCGINLGIIILISLHGYLGFMRRGQAMG